MARRAHATLAAGIGNKKFMSAIRTSYPSKSFLNIAAFKEPGDGITDDRPPETIFFFIPFCINTFKFVIVLIDKLIKW